MQSRVVPLVLFSFGEPAAENLAKEARKMRNDVRFISVPKDPEGLPSPSIFLRAGAPVASWDEVVPLGAVPTQWLLLFVNRIVQVPQWLRSAAAMVLLRRAELGGLEEDPTLDRLDKAFLPSTLEKASEIVSSMELRTKGGKVLKSAWERTIDDFLSYQRMRKECDLPPLPTYDE